MREQDFERLFSEHAEPLFAFLAYRTGDRALAEDLLAETFERVLRARRGFDARRGSEKAWLYTIALNRLRDHLRTRAAESRALDRAAADLARRSAGDQGEGVERRDLLARALRTLSEDEREAIALRFGADLTGPEIARLTGQPLTTVEGRIYRGLRKLRDLLA